MSEVDPASPHVDLGGYLLGSLGRREREAFEEHLHACSSCQHELEQLRGLPTLLEQTTDPVTVPPSLEARVLDAVAREPNRRTERQPAALRLASPRPGPRRPPRWAPAALVAAIAVAFLAGIGLGRALPPGGGAAPGPQPAQQTISLVATNGGTASGVATIRGGGGGKVIELTVRGLDPPQAGYVYTCWLVANDDTPQRQDRVSVGSFTTRGPQPVKVRWETAADLERFPNLGVTLEPQNGNPLRQGPKVLTAG